MLGNARMVLVDLREGSPTEGRIQTLILGEHSPKMVAIPPFVAHGYQALDLRDVILNYYVTDHMIRSILMRGGSPNQLPHRVRLEHREHLTCGFS